MSGNEVVQLNKEQAAPEDEIDLSPFFAYLKTPQGHEVAKNVIGFMNDIKKLTLDRSSSHFWLETIAKYSVIAIVVAAVTYLSSQGKLDTTTGMLFGTIVGYFFGQKAR